ncbi:HAD family phosphatase [Candidatus Micrarchaeota archaeon]|nr:HAD family phosphatase [Candidatus Micrarchaeota archaeon]
MDAVIFDFDGVILDSEPEHHEAFETLFERNGIPFSETPQTMTGIPARKLIPMVAGKAGITLSAEKIAAMDRQRDEIYLDLILHRATLLPGALEMLQSLKRARIKIALASSSNDRLLQAILPRVGLFGVFDAVIGGDHVPHGKPNPDIFLKAAEALGVPPNGCVVIEDANAGVQAARAAGMKVLMVRNGRIVQDKDNATAFVESLVGLTPAFLQSL